jgi:nitroreductase/NAD-dependent dihydropyrimidine dehydrogenase PreA subunit
MLNFIVSEKTCIKCGQCSADCPARIIDMKDVYPSISKDKENLCYKCQHCFAICPTGALSLLGLDPKKSLPLPKTLPDSKQIELLIKGRRSIRSYKEENLEPELLQRLLEVASYAPTGKNTREVRFTLVDGQEKMAKMRSELMDGLGKIVRAQKLPAGMEFFANIHKVWEEKEVDILFRKAPHLLITSAPQNGVTPIPDCLIALSYFEIFAQSLGVGTLWDGLAKWAINDLVPEMKKSLGIPSDHVIGYAMVFGKPAIHYARTAQRSPTKIHRV